MTVPFGRKKCVVGSCQRTCKDDGRFYCWICSRCMKCVDKTILKSWKTARRAHRNYERAMRRKDRRKRPYHDRRASINFAPYRARVSVWIESNRWFFAAVQDARIKRAMGIG